MELPQGEMFKSFLVTFTAIILSLTRAIELNFTVPGLLWPKIDMSQTNQCHLAVKAKHQLQVLYSTNQYLKELTYKYINIPNVNDKSDGP